MVHISESPGNFHNICDQRNGFSFTVGHITIIALEAKGPIKETYDKLRP